LVSGAESGANFSLEAYCNLVKRVEVVILLPRLFSSYVFHFFLLYLLNNTKKMKKKTAQDRKLELEEIERKKIEDAARVREQYKDSLRLKEEERITNYINSLNTTKDKVIAILSIVSGIPESEIQEDTIIYYEKKSELSFDWLDIIEVVMYLQKFLHIDFPDALVQDIRDGKVYDHPKFKTVIDLIDICNLLQRLSKTGDFDTLLKIIREK
jgi:acyl carrier protein